MTHLCQNMRLVVMTGIAVLLFTNPVIPLADDLDHEKARKLVQSGVILPLERVLAGHQRVREGRILEVELEKKHGILVYEIEVMDEQGRVMEFTFDAKTGHLRQEKQEK